MAIQFTLVFPYRNSDTLPPTRRDCKILDALKLIGRPHEPGEWVPERDDDDDSPGLYYYTWDQIADEKLFRELVESARCIGIHREDNEGLAYDGDTPMFSTVRGAISAVNRKARLETKPD